jgi:hypothetical protein
VVGPLLYAPWQVASDLSRSLLELLVEPQEKHEGKLMCGRQPQSACAAKKLPLTNTTAKANPRISFLLILSLLQYRTVILLSATTT